MNIEFYQLVVLAITIMFIPIIKVPFKMLSTYFHELGHGLMAIVTFGSVIKIVLNFDGSGVCHFKYKNKFYLFFIALSGYIATSLAGYYIYYIAKLNSEIITLENIYIILGLIFISIVLWVRDIKTFILVLIIAILFIVPILDNYIIEINIAKYTVVYMQLIGVYVMIDALIAPFHLIDGKDDGDGGDLASITGIPEAFWIVIWLSIASYTLYLAYLL